MPSDCSANVANVAGLTTPKTRPLPLPMRPSEPSLRRLMPVRLTDVRAEVRLAAARQEARRSTTPDEREALYAAALDPSDTTYWLTWDARPILSQVAA